MDVANKISLASFAMIGTLYFYFGVISFLGYIAMILRFKKQAVQYMRQNIDDVLLLPVWKWFMLSTSASRLVDNVSRYLRSNHIMFKPLGI